MNAAVVETPACFQFLFSQNSYAFGLLLFCMNRINAMLFVCYVGSLIAMILLENVEKPYCINPRVLLKPRKFIHWPGYCFIGWEPIKTFHFAGPKRIASISEAQYYKFAIGWPLFDHCSMLFAHVASIIYSSSKIHFSLKFHPKIMKLFASCPWRCLVFYCDF